MRRFCAFTLALRFCLALCCGLGCLLGAGGLLGRMRGTAVLTQVKAVALRLMQQSGHRHTACGFEAFPSGLHGLA